MANTTLSSIATQVAASAVGEKRKSALGDGTAKPGDSVGIILATGKVIQTDIGVSELFTGFLDINVETDMDTAIVDGVPCEIIVPQSGHEYNILIEDPAGDEGEGTPYTFSDTAGAMEAAASAILGLARLASTIATGDTYGKVRWD